MDVLSGTQKGIEMAIVGVIGVTGLATNLMAIVTASLTFRNLLALHLMLVILTTLDLGVVLLYIPSYMIALKQDFSSIPQQVCITMTIFFYIFLSCNACVNLLLAFSRVVLSRSQKIYKRWFTLRRTVVYLSITCFVAVLALIIPLVAAVATVSSDQDGIQCLEVGHQLTPYVGITLPYAFFIPAHGTALCYLIVFLKIRSVRDSGGRYKRDWLQGGITMLMSMFILVVCWCPFLFVQLLDPYQRSIPPLVHRVVLYLLLLNPALNSLTYTFRASDFKKGIRHLLNMDLKLRSVTDNMYNEDFQDFDEEFRERAADVSVFFPVKSLSRSRSRPVSRAHSKKSSNLDMATVQSAVPMTINGKEVRDTQEARKDYMTQINRMESMQASPDSGLDKDPAATKTGLIKKESAAIPVCTKF